MKIETKFSINDTVWHIWKERKQEWESCPACSGSGQITLADEKNRLCPECYGRCGKTVHLELEWVVTGSLTIGQVQVTIKNIESDGDFSNIGSHKEGADEYKCQYMAYETGIGSGTCHYEELLFATEAEAQEECDVRNAATTDANQRR